ncbi:hypothetical protein [Halobacteriovorax marinus]|uniref:hypothetical protein n=1 Tax=Halobacteriovorax marinus TaxID=97084 RepID=UPI003A8F73F4
MKTFLALLILVTPFSSSAYEPSYSQRRTMADYYHYSKYSEMAKLLKEGYDPNDIIESPLVPMSEEFRYIHGMSSSKVDYDIEEEVLEVLNILIEKGAYLEASTKSGEFPVYLASTGKKLKILHKAGADIFRKFIDKEGVVLRAREYVRSAEGLDYMYEQGMKPDCDYIHNKFSEIENKWYKHHYGVGYKERCR